MRASGLMKKGLKRLRIAGHVELNLAVGALRKKGLKRRQAAGSSPESVRASALMTKGLKLNRTQHNHLLRRDLPVS